MVEARFEIIIREMKVAMAGYVAKIYFETARLGSPFETRWRMVVETLLHDSSKKN